MSNEILVLGATGKTGSRIVERLTKLGLPVRIGSRNISPAFDWENRSTWMHCLKDISKVYISFQPDLTVPGSVDKITAFVEAARQSGVKQLVLLSGRGEIASQHCENIVINSKLDWTIVRASWFMQNFSEGFLLEGILSGHMVLPKTYALEPFIDVDDIADVVTKIFTDDSLNKKILELTGPGLLSFESAVQQISAVSKQPIVYEGITAGEYTELLKSYAIPEDFIWLITYLFTEVMDGRNESLTNDVETILGRKAGTFQSYITKVAATGTWQNKELKAS